MLQTLFGCASMTAGYQDGGFFKSGQEMRALLL